MTTVFHARIRLMIVVLVILIGVFFLDPIKTALSIEWLSLQIRLAPDSAERYYQRGFIKDKKLRDHHSAIRDYSLALEHDPLHLKAWARRGDENFALADYWSSISDYSIALMLDPVDPDLYFLRGDAYLWSASPRQAIHDYTRTLDLNPLYASAYQERSLSWLALGDFAEACHDQKRACSLFEAQKDILSLRRCERLKTYIQEKRKPSQPELFELNSFPRIEY